VNKGAQASARVRRERADRLQQDMARLRRVEGLTNPQIDARLGVSSGLARQYMGATPTRIGGMTYWDPAMRDRARYLRECGYTITEISEQTDVPRSTVGDWVRGMPCG
jgi:hypothetical protein